ncbi:hypothetical protein [Roseococcus sp. YIM B11640]|uniref:hypothetical protein n=1 Tax=Roseococcus sp. YIM B11640 TaxID=3133973 RepID=UPI003C7BC057
MNCANAVTAGFETQPISGGHAYFLRVRNTSRWGIAFVVTVSGFPSTVTLVSSNQTGSVRVGGETLIRLGQGTASSIPVVVANGTNAGSGATVQLGQCFGSG